MLWCPSSGQHAVRDVAVSRQFRYPRGVKTHFPPFTGILIFSESRRSFRSAGNADSARSVHLHRRLIVKSVA